MIGAIMSREDVAEGVVAGKYRLLFFTPETFFK